MWIYTYIALIIRLLKYLNGIYLDFSMHRGRYLCMLLLNLISAFDPHRVRILAINSQHNWFLIKFFFF